MYQAVSLINEGMTLGIIHQRLSTASCATRPDIRVWNLSMGTRRRCYTPCSSNTTKRSCCFSSRQMRKIRCRFLSPAWTSQRQCAAVSGGSAHLTHTPKYYDYYYSDYWSSSWSTKRAEEKDLHWRDVMTVVQHLTVMSSGFWIIFVLYRLQSNSMFTSGCSTEMVITCNNL